MKLYCHGCPNFSKSIGMRVRTNEDRIGLLTICQFCKHSNSIMLDELKVEELIELLNIINETVLH